MSLGHRRLPGIRVALLSAFACVMLSGCLYTNIKIPLDTNVEETQLGSKTGTSSWRSVLWLFAWGDSSTALAAKNGNITTIKHLDEAQKIIFFGLYTESTTIAYGD